MCRGARCRKHIHAYDSGAMAQEAVRSQLARYNQEHLLQFVDELDEERRKELFADIAAVDFEELHR